MTKLNPRNNPDIKVVSTSDAGSLRVRSQADGWVVIDAPGLSWICLIFAVAFGCSSVYAVGQLTLPPHPSIVGGITLCLIALVAAGVAIASGWGFMLGCSRLIVHDGTLSSRGPRWGIQDTDQLTVLEVRLEEGPQELHGEMLERQTWLLRFRCRGDGGQIRDVDVLQAWRLEGVRRKGLDAAEVLAVPFRDCSLETPEPG